MYYFAAYMQELSAADVIDEYNTITKCPGGQIFNVSLFRCVSSYVPQVLGVSFSIESFDRVALKQCVGVILGFTPSTTVHDGGTITLTYPSGFFVPGVTPTVAPGATSVAELTATCSATSTTSIVLTTSGATIEKTAFLVTIRGFTMGSATPGALGIIVKTSSDTVASNPVASGFISFQVSSVSFSIAVSDRVAGKTPVPVTLGFTPASPVPVGGTITITYPSGFFNLPNNPCSVYVPAFPSSSSTIANFNSYYCDASSTTSVVITTSGATISASAFKVTIYGFKMGSATKNTLGILIQTSTDRAASIAVESGSVVCPAGSFLVTNVSSLICTKCLQGYFCPGIGNTNPTNCTAGKHCASIGLAAVSGECEAGSYSAGGATSAACTPCPGGKYCAGAGLAAVSGECEAGSYSAGGATSAACTPCPGGKYCAGAGLAAVSGECEAGSYSAGGATSAACTPCPGGKYCAGAGLAAVSGECEAGSYSAGGATSAACTPCPGGKYCAGAGLAAVSGECEAGSYSAGGATSAACTPCPGGKYCAGAGLAAVSGECEAGLYSAGGATSAACTPCPGGKYCAGAGLAAVSGECEAGSYSAGGATSAACTPCPGGKYCAGAGLAAVSGDCEAGSYSAGGATSAACTPCPGGKYCAGAGLAAVSGECEAGSYSAGGATSAACTPCPGGKYCAGAGLAAVSGDCEAGSYSAGGATSAACTPCPGGKYCAGAGLAAVSGECEAGSYSAGGATSAACTPCPGGKYCAGAGLAAVSGECQAGSYSAGGATSAACTPCPGGKYCAGAGLAAVSGECEAGSYSAGGATSAACTPCPGGKYCAGAGLAAVSGECEAGSYSAGGATSAACTPCPGGKYCAGAGLAAVSGECEAGSYSAGGATSAACTPCPGGKYCAGAGLAAVSGECEAGSYSAGGATSAACTPCPGGKYCAGAGLAAVSGECQAGSYSAGGATSAACTPCPGGKYCAGAGLAAVSGDCEAGSYSAGGATSAACTPCPGGKYCAGAGLAAVSGECEAGSYSAGGATSAACTPCPGGKYCAGAGLAAVSGECEAGSYSAGGATSAACTPCPGGKYCAGAGLAAVSGDCEAGSYSAGGATSAACTPCPGGKYCAGAGLAAVSGDCEAGSYSAGGATSAACTPCPGGKYCAGAGLVSFSGDCIISSFSLSGALSFICTPCPVGFFGNSTGLSSCHRCAFGFVSQKGSYECQDLEHQRIVLTLTGSIQTFSEGSERRRSFIVGLATILDIPERQIAIISVSSGSVIVELAFIRDSASSVSPVQAAIRLQEATSAGKLQEFGVTDLNIGGESVFTQESSSEIPVIVGSSIGVSLSVLLIAVVTIFAIKKMRSRRPVLQGFIQIQEKDIVFDTKFTAHGAYGFVRKGKWNGLDVAVKRMTANSSEEDRQNFIREAKTMHAITHPHCVPLYGVCSSDQSLSLVMEFMGGGDLLTLLQDAPPPLHRRISLFRQICSGLNYLHNVRDIIHADIKPSNILLSSDGRTAKIADFGLSRMKVQGGHSTAANIDGTLNYLPPERLYKKTKADRSGDIYAMGCLLWETITCNIIWCGVLLPDLIISLHNKERPDIPANVDPEIANLIRDCWAEDPVHRPHAVDLWRRVSELDVNNPDFNKPLDPYPSSYVPTCNSLEDCMRKALDPVIFDGLFADMYMIDAKYNEKSVQNAVKEHGLSETEAKCIILYTMESMRVPKTQQFYRLFNQAYRRRNEEKLELFADFSFHFWNGMSKLPPGKAQSGDCALTLYRGIHMRLADISDLYDQGKRVHLHETTSCSSSMEKAKEKFAKKGGTLLSLINVTQAKSIAVFSLIPDEQEFILDFTSVFDIITALTFEKARSLKNFSSNPHVPKSGDLPDGVDLVVMQFMCPQKTSQDLLTATRKGSSGRHIHANILQDALSASLTHCKTGQDICNSGHLPSEQTSEPVVLSREKYSEDCLAAKSSVFVENSLSLTPSDAISVSLPGTVDYHSFPATAMNAALEQPSQFQMSNNFSFSDFSESRQITNPATIFKESILRASPDLAPLSAANDDSFCDENGTPLSETVMAPFSPPFKRSVAATNESP
jgi:hypothetical protein